MHQCPQLFPDCSSLNQVQLSNNFYISSSDPTTSSDSGGRDDQSHRMFKRASIDGTIMPFGSAKPRGMYRSMYWHGDGETSQCTRNPCDWRCKKLHQYEEEPTSSSDFSSKRDSLQSSSGTSKEKLEATPSTSRVSDRVFPSSTPSSTSSSPDDDFKRIMRSAQNLVDPSYVEPPLPQAHHPAIKSARERKKNNKLARHMSIFEDTTKVNYHDGERSRPDSSDDEAVVNLNVAPPSIIDEEDSSVDNLLRDVKSDIHSNPVSHDFGDEHIFRNDEDNDFIDNDIDLAVQRKLSIESHSSIKIPKPRRPEFERNLFEGSLDIPDIPPPQANGKKK